MDNKQINSEKKQDSSALPSSLKCRNRKNVMACFRDYQDHTVAEIVARTGISKLTVMRAIQFFCRKGVLVSGGKGESTEQGGKRPECFRFACSKYLLSITMWPEKLNLTLFHMNLQVAAADSCEWIVPVTPGEAFRYIRQRTKKLLTSVGAAFGDLLGVNLSTSGIVDYENLILKYSVHFPLWGINVPIGKYLKEIFGTEPVFYIENAGKCVSRAAMEQLDYQNKRILVLFTSWGLAGALIESGKILNGRDSLIGEIGHIILDPNDREKCICGSCGCAGILISEHRFRTHLAADPPPADSLLANKAPGEATLRDLFGASARGDAYANGYVDYLAHLFSILIRNVSVSFNPETVVFVGDYALAGARFDARVKEDLSQFCYFLPSAPMEILYDTRSLPDMDARGGALALMDIYFSDETLYADEEV